MVYKYIHIYIFIRKKLKIWSALMQILWSVYSFCFCFYFWNTSAIHHEVSFDHLTTRGRPSCHPACLFDFIGGWWSRAIGSGGQCYVLVVSRRNVDQEGRDFYLFVFGSVFSKRLIVQPFPPLWKLEEENLHPQTWSHRIVGTQEWRKNRWRETENQRRWRLSAGPNRLFSKVFKYKLNILGNTQIYCRIFRDSIPETHKSACFPKNPSGGRRGRSASQPKQVWKSTEGEKNRK